MLRIAIATTGLLYLTACCCCGGGGGGSTSSTSGGWGDALKEKASEELAEEIAAGLTGADEIEVDEKTGTFTIKTKDGEMVITGDDDQGSMTFKGPGGETMEWTGGKNTAIPEDFPLSIPPPYTGAGTQRMETPEGILWMVAVQHEGATVEDILAAWEAELASHGETVSRAEGMQGSEKGVMLTVEAPDRIISVMVGSEGGEVVSMATVAPKN